MVQVTADELAEYTRYNVRQATKAQQTPTSDRGSFDPNMPLSYIPTILSEGAQQRPDQFGTLIFESNMDEVEVFVDGESSGLVNKGKPLRLPGLRPGSHSIKAVRMGYEPDGPREEMVYPGQTTTVTIKILYARRRDKAALDELDKGIELYNKGFENNYRKAAAHFEKALAIDPKYSQAALYLGRAYSALFEYKQSEAAYRKALEIDPDYLEARAEFRRHAARHRRFRRSDPPIDARRRPRQEAGSGLRHAGPGLPHEGHVPGIDRGRAPSHRADPGQRRASLFSRRQPAAERQAGRRQTRIPQVS